MDTDSFFKFDLQDIAGKIWGAKWRILAFQLLVLVACVSVILFWPRSYRSEARIFLQLGHETVAIDPTAATGQMIGIQQSSREDEIVTAMDVLKGRGLIGAVVDQLTPAVVLGHSVGDDDGKRSPVLDFVNGMKSSVIDTLRSIDPMSDRERAVTLIEKNLGIDAERKSEVIVIDYEAETPQLAQIVVDCVVKTYRDEHVRLHRTEGSKSFFDSQQELLQKELDAINQSLRLAKNRMGLASIEGEKQSLEMRMRETNQTLSDTERALFEVQAKSENLRRQLDSRPERIASAEVQKPNSVTDTQSTQLYALQLTELEYKSKFSPGHPRLVAIRAQVEEAERNLKQQSENRSETTNDVNPIYRELTMEFVKNEAAKAGLEKRYETIKRQNEDLQKQIRLLNSNEIEITDLEREAKLREKKYLTYSESLEQVRLNQALESDKISSVSIAQEATLQEKPVTPSKLLVILFSGMSMLAGGSLIALASVKLDDRLTTPASVRAKLGIPVLVSIPKSRFFSQLQAQK